MKKKQLITTYAVCVLIVFMSTNTVFGQYIEEIYTKDYTESFIWIWVGTKTGIQEVEQLFPYDNQAKNADNADVIKWHWEKKENKWIGWGMEWKGWDKSTNFFELVGQDKSKRDLALQLNAEEFSRHMSEFELQFKVKGFISEDRHKPLVLVKFDSRGFFNSKDEKPDVPTEEIAFLSYIKDEKGQMVELSPSQFYTVRIPLNEFHMLKKRVKPSKMKHIVFRSPDVEKTEGTLYLYDIKIIKVK
jgi:hypothetical protein